MVVIEEGGGPDEADQAGETGGGPEAGTGRPALTVIRTRPAEVGGATATEAQLEDGRALILYSWADEPRR